MANTVVAPKGKPRELPPVGTHQAVCIGVVDMGTQPGSQKYPQEKPKYRLVFELNEEFDSEGNPFKIDKEYTFVDTSKSILRADWNSWIAQPGDIIMNKFAGKSALITIVRKKTDKGEYANVTTITALPKGMQPKRPQNDVYEFYLTEDGFSEELLETFPDWLKEKIEASPEYKALTAVEEPQAPPPPPAKKAAAPVKQAPAKSAPPKKAAKKK